MTTLLQALLRNESGGRNIPNVHEGTSSGQAQGYFQITTGTWKDFAPQAGIDLRQYPTPMTAADGTPVPYEVQAKVASTIPLKRWDESTVAKMRATGIPINPNATLGENLSGAGEGFDQGGITLSSTPFHRGGAGSDPANFVNVTSAAPTAAPAEPAKPQTWFEGFKQRLMGTDEAGKETEGAGGGITDLVSAIRGDTDKGKTADEIAGGGGGQALQAAATEDAARSQAAAMLMSSILSNRRRTRGASINTIPTGVI